MQLDDIASARERLEAFKASPALVQEARALLPALEVAATAPAGAEGVMRVVGSRFALFPQPDRSDAEHAAWWDDYVAVLAAFPEARLDAGMRALIAEGAEFMPRPGKLREAAIAATFKEGWRYVRATMALKELEGYDPPRTTRSPPIEYAGPPRMSERKRDVAAVRAMAADFAARSAGTDARRDYAWTQAPVDGGGITAAMRKHLGG